MSRFPPLSPPRNAARPAIVLPPLSLSGRNHFLPGQARNRSSSALVKVSAAIAANKHRKDRNRSSSALSVRYGEEADQVELLSDWSCPKCRGKCTCSCCRKKQGLVPTGQLVKTANASGYKSVDELLHNANNVSVSPMEEATLLGLHIILYVEAEKENSLDGIFYKVVEYLLNMSRKLRNYIDEKNLIFSEETKEAKSKVKCLKQNFVGRQISDATRIDPVFLDDGGQIFWKLKGYTAKYVVLLQDIKVHDVDGTATEEKWFVCDLEIKHEIDKYISSRFVGAEFDELNANVFQLVYCNLTDEDVYQMVDLNTTFLY
ncbi:hypothetical protein OROGR_017976 [Orobanche gracilis]